LNVLINVQKTHDCNSKGKLLRTVKQAIYRIRYLPQISAILDGVRYSGVMILSSKIIFYFPPLFKRAYGRTTQRIQFARSVKHNIGHECP
jgi:hypothetical protein